MKIMVLFYNGKMIDANLSMGLPNIIVLKQDVSMHSVLPFDI